MSLCSAVFSCVAMIYGIPIQEKKTLWSSTMSSDPLGHWNCQILSQEVVVGDLLSALERIFCAEGQLKLLGDLGTRCCTFLGSGTTTPQPAVWLVETCQVFHNFGKFWIFSIQNWLLGLVFLKSFEFPGILDMATCFPIHPLEFWNTSPNEWSVNHKDVVLLTTENTKVMAQNYIAIYGKPQHFDHI